MPFDVFSKRGKPLPDVFVYDELPLKLRQQLAYLYDDTLGKLSCNHGMDRPIGFFDQIRHVVVRENGVPHLPPAECNDPFVEIRYCLLQGGDVPLVLDLVEKIFQTVLLLSPGEHTPCDFELENAGLEAQEAVKELNHRFRENGVGYQFDVNSKTLVRVDSLLVYATVIQPVLLLLSQAEYKVPNDEFLSALDDYKKAKYSEAITKAGSAYESVMKVILAKKQWPHDPTRPASHLVKAIVDNAPLDGGYNQVLMSVANVRNLASSAHGGGTTARVAEEHHCQLTLNLAASAMLYLVEEFG
ncbi:hypothetical protein ETAA8_66190 [Anatilimnocola aggregata]|uniref:Abortive infection protein-like C-terminal domain-containing protein n=1 Tax=Anatilimnocola aggregata TaxID=2528021 RepID=A0A517YMM7_9BACT|nr:hypothetical protein [Anatilimnocola aggregata]QDU31461.1 hypothetical protein ETAA8_66190 [Anatilimnocola aggregata]